MRSYHVGILAAGLGSRLQEISKAKPLANLAGRSLLERLTTEFQYFGVEQITCALRDELLPPEDRAKLPQKNIKYLYVNTESSLHTLQEIIAALPSAPNRTLFSMVDTIMHRKDLGEFLDFCSSLPAGECALLVTPHVDDEKPLWVQVNSEGYITRFGSETGPYVTSGMYFLTPEAMKIAHELIQTGTHKMRNFLAVLAERNIPIKTFVVEKTIDVDHPSDLDQAESFLRKRWEVMSPKPLKILGIYRLPLFSNNAIEVDRLILEESIAALRHISPTAIDIEMVEEPNVFQVNDTYDLVLTMAQSETALQEIQKKFPSETVWNSAVAVRNCYRKTMSNALIDLDVNYVPFQVLPTDGSIKPLMQANQSYWLKRSDFHAIADEDVSLAETPTEATEKLRRFHERGVSEVILQPHIHGDIYKFYGVKGKFFRALKVRDFLKSTAVPDFSLLQTNVSKSADALGLLIYGGDAILDDSGVFHLIDLNDWPSFRICRPEAAQAIAELANDYFMQKRSSQQMATTTSSGLI